MTVRDIESELRQIVCEQLGCKPGEVRPEAKFDNLGADSLDAVELQMAVEEVFGIELSDEEADKCRTFGDALALIRRLVA